MRLVYIAWPFGAALACAGLLMGLKASSAAPSSSPSSGTEPRHPVTAEMALAAANEAKKAAPDFTLPDPTGRTWSLGRLTDGKPLFLYFILNDCPCSTDAEPLFHLLYERYKGKVNFAGVIGSDTKVAAAWAKSHQMPYPILADPGLGVINAYHASNSVYNALITPNGRIERMWPGYSADTLREMNAVMAAAIGERERPFDPLYAPLKLSSGCRFLPAK